MRRPPITTLKHKHKQSKHMTSSITHPSTTSHHSLMPVLLQLLVEAAARFPFMRWLKANVLTTHAPRGHGRFHHPPLRLEAARSFVRALVRLRTHGYRRSTSWHKKC